MKRLALIVCILFACSIGMSQNSCMTISLALPDPCSTTAVHNYDNVVPENGLTLVVQPNPSKGNFYCKLSDSEPLGEVIASVIDMKGRIIRQEKWYSENETIQTKMSLEFLSSGIYLLSVNTKNNRTSAKIIIEK